VTSATSATSAYRQVFATPGLRSVMVLGLLAKVPNLGIAAVIVLHVVNGLDLGFGPGGVAAAVWTAGVGLGAPFQGRALDRYGLRALLAIVVVVQAVFWGFAPLLPYPALLGATFLGGLLTLPVFTILRLTLAVLVAEEVRHTAYVADSISTDIAYMAGPSIGILLATQASSAVAFLVMGGLVMLAAAGFAVVNPSLRTAQVSAVAGRWLTGRLACVLGVTFGVALAVLGFEVAAVGTLQRLGQLEWSWVFLIVCGACSIAGGLVYGSLRRPPPAVLIAACLGVAVIPVGFADHWLWLCVLAAPANFLIAPALAATASAVSELAPAGSKGVAMGAYASAMMIGNVAGSPLAGAGLDLSGPVAAFAVIGCASALTAGVAFLADRRLAGP